MEELIKVTYDNDRITVSARELHEFLGIETRFNDWFKRMCSYGFSENVDYMAVTQKRVTAQGNETTYVDHQLTIEMAKEIAMLQRNERGKEARQYFLNLEKKWNSPQYVMNRALEYSRKQVQKLLEENESMKPKAEYYDMILQSKSLVNITQIAADYGMTANEFNDKLHKMKIQFRLGSQWILYKQYKNCGYTHSETFDFKHTDGTSDVKMHTKWTQKGRLFLYERLKEEGTLPTIEKRLGINNKEKCEVAQA